MNHRFLFALVALVATALSARAADNELTAAEKSAGWTLLFDGKSLDGWRGYKHKPIVGWEVADGTLHAKGGTKGGIEIITEKKYTDYELSWDWKLSVGGNNGVKYFVTEERPGAPGHEYQMLDDARHADAKFGALRQTASFYCVLPPAADKPYREAGEWNSSRIVVKGTHVEHWLNGKMVLAYETSSPAVKAGVANSKFKNQPGFGDKIPGYIMLTYHHDDCWFKNIKLRELN